MNHPISDLRRQVHQRVVAGGRLRENSIQRRARMVSVYECLPQGLVVHQVAPAAVDQMELGFIRARKAPSTISRVSSVTAQWSEMMSHWAVSSCKAASVDPKVLLHLRRTAVAGVMV